MKSPRAAPTLATSRSTKPENMFWWRTTPAAALRCSPCSPMESSARLRPSCSTPARARIPQRQEGPHAHSIDLSPDNRFAMVDDLGLDELLVYKFDSAKGSLTPNDPPFAKLDAGAGPRHFALRPDGKFAYVISEMGHTVTVFSNDAASGRLQALANNHDSAQGFHWAQRRRGNPGASLREVSLRLQPRRRQHRNLRDRPKQGNADTGRDTFRPEARSRAASRSIPRARCCLRRIRSPTTSSCFEIDAEDRPADAYRKGAGSSVAGVFEIRSGGVIAVET